MAKKNTVMILNKCLYLKGAIKKFRPIYIFTSPDKNSKHENSKSAFVSMFHEFISFLKEKTPSASHQTQM